MTVGLKRGLTVARTLFPDYFHEHALAAAAVKFAVENLFPRTEIEFVFGEGDHDLAAP